MLDGLQRIGVGLAHTGVFPPKSLIVHTTTYWGTYAYATPAEQEQRYVWRFLQIDLPRVKTNTS